MMKRLLILCMASLLLIAMSGFAVASGTGTVAVTGTVIAKCNFKTNGTMDFGNLDPTIGGAVAGVVVQPTFKCTKGINLGAPGNGITVSGANDVGVNHFIKDAVSTDTIPYTILFTAAPVVIAGASQPMDLSGNIAAGAYDDASAGNYADTLTFTINP